MCFDKSGILFAQLMTDSARKEKRKKICSCFTGLVILLFFLFKKKRNWPTYSVLMAV